MGIRQGKPRPASRMEPEQLWGRPDLWPPWWCCVLLGRRCRYPWCKHQYPWRYGNLYKCHTNGGNANQYPSREHTGSVCCNLIVANRGKRKHNLLPAKCSFWCICQHIFVCWWSVNQHIFYWIRRLHLLAGGRSPLSELHPDIRCQQVCASVWV